MLLSSFSSSDVFEIFASPLVGVLNNADDIGAWIHKPTSLTPLQRLGAGRVKPEVAWLNENTRIVNAFAALENIGRRCLRPVPISKIHIRLPSV